MPLFTVEDNGDLGYEFFNWNKTEIQLSLEKQGWKFFTNVSLEGYLDCVTRKRVPHRTEDEVRKEYESKGLYEKVLVTMAFDCKGRELKDCRAIYVK